MSYAIATDTLNIGDGLTARTFMIEGGSTFPGIVFPGLRSYEWAAQMAGEGFTVLCPPSHLSPQDCADVVAVLRRHWHCDGHVAMAAARDMADDMCRALGDRALAVDAAVALFPTPSPRGDFTRAAAQQVGKPLMMVVGGQDSYTPDSTRTLMTSVAANMVTYVAGRAAPIREQNGNGNNNILTAYYGNTNHVRSGDDYSTQRHIVGVAAEFLRHAMAGGGVRVLSAPLLNTMPDSHIYRPVVRR